jgi:hypothetical protein
MGNKQLFLFLPVNTNRAGYFAISPQIYWVKLRPGQRPHSAGLGDEFDAASGQ